MSAHALLQALVESSVGPTPSCLSRRGPLAFFSQRKASRPRIRAAGSSDALRKRIVAFEDHRLAAVPPCRPPRRRCVINGPICARLPVAHGEASSFVHDSALSQADHVVV